jgi:hypothetical protein
MGTDQECEIGTYNDKYGADDVAYCITCPEGLICDEYALAEPKDTCPGGYYCTGLTEEPCEVGHYCPNNVIEQLKCEPGEY